jgi:phytoene synthase
VPLEGEPLTLAQDYRRCREIAFARGRNFSVGMRTLPRGKREATYAVYAFCRVADDFADESATPAEALDAWEEELGRVYGGRPRTAVGRALADAARRFPIPAEPFRRLIEGGRRDQRQGRYASRADLEVYISEVAWTISDLTLPIFGFSDPAAVERGRDLATALQLTNIVRDVGEDARRNRIYLPRETLIRFGASEEDVLKRRPTEGLLRAIEFEAARARENFARSRGLLPLLSRDSRRAVFLFAWVYGRVLSRVERDPATALV